VEVLQAVAEQDLVVTQVLLAEKLQTVTAETDTPGGGIMYNEVVAVVLLVDQVVQAVADLVLDQTILQQAMAPPILVQVPAQVILVPWAH
jgi:hypothetical protein